MDVQVEKGKGKCKNAVRLPYSRHELRLKQRRLIRACTGWLTESSDIVLSRDIWSAWRDAMINSSALLAAVERHAISLRLWTKTGLRRLYSHYLKKPKSLIEESIQTFCAFSLLLCNSSENIHS